MRRYNPKEIEPRWRKNWDDEQIYKADLASDKPKYIAMSMFNYPSGNGIHIGHAMNYTISDVMARFKRQQGYESYHPVGWDAFGLPAENYAIKTGVSPQQSMATIIPSYHKQYKAMGWSNDWTKEISTHLPEYYKWTQWIFAEMFRAGMAYQDARLQWWCTKCQTVLANEQVIDGKCWRHDGPDDPEVKKKEVKQWFFKVTDYAEEMLDATYDLDWSEVVKTAQINWIGKSQGAEVEFTVPSSHSHKGGNPVENVSQSDIKNWISDRVRDDELLEAKDTLKFTPDLTEAIQKGDKFVTYRYEAKDVQVGDTVKLITRFNAKETRAFAYARITKAETVPLRDVPNQAEGHHAYADDADKLEHQRSFYGEDVTLDSPFTIYEFEKLADIITVFTTRPDTLYGATFMVVAPEHELVASITTESQKNEVDAYVAAATKKTDVERQENKEKTGVFTGAYAVNPVNGAKVPIWIADYVLTGYGTGAIMAVPAHDERDNEFAQKFNLPIIRVVKNDAPDDECSHDEGVMMNSGEYDGMPSADAREKIVADLSAKGIAEAKTNFRIRDWSVSRQRYWGAPIPIINCPNHGAVLDPNLPVILPELEDFQPSGDGRSALARATDWLRVPCPVCGEMGERETDTLDTYICSSWYFLRYFDPANDKAAFDSVVANKWMPVDFYNGGDHATAHMIYARFVTRFFWHQGLLAEPEPFKRFLFNGKVTASDGTMFSKSKGNGVDPLEIIEQGYGADALRTYLMFAAPLDLWIRWDPQGVPGTFRFLQRVWNLTQEFLETQPPVISTEAAGAAEKSPTKDREDLSTPPPAGGFAQEDNAVAVLRVIHPVIRKVTADLEEQKYNTAIAAMMKCVNDLYVLKAAKGFENTAAWQSTLESLVALVAPFAPHTADELWHNLGKETSIQRDSWPLFEETYCVADTVTLAIQVNGKLRGTVEVPADADEAASVAAAKADEKVASYLAEGNLLKTIYVPAKLINFVVR